MKKKIIALTLIFAMLVPFVPAAAAEETAERPTVEEILSQYHQAAFEAEMNGEEAAAYSPRSGSNGPTLEQQTVDTLNEAGYEAYNVTADNYDTLEEQLHTDFADMGLDPEGSYIIVIHGEEEQSPNGNARLGDILLPPHPWEDDNGHLPNTFSHTYNGTTYRMRYVTVTVAENSQLQRHESFDLYKDNSTESISTYLDWQFTITSALCDLFGVPALASTTYSLLSLIGTDIDLDQIQGGTYLAATNWTVTYVQVLNAQQNIWKFGTSFERVAKNYAITYSYYDSIDDYCKFATAQGELEIQYSKYYDNKDLLKDYAALAYENNTRYLDVIEEVNYEYKGQIVLDHNRWNEPSGYEPA